MFTGHESHDISLNDASEMTAEYRRQNPNGIKGAFFGRDAIEAILAQTACVGIRYYYGLDAAGEQKLILVGADKFENDLHTGLLAEFAEPCPNQCSQDNPLNS